MKKSVSLLLVLIMALSLVPSAYAFEDISDYSEKAAAESLASLGIVDNVDRYNPNDLLTRAQFCKIAVLAAGFEEESLYRGYTIYPDVAAGSWYAPYVNAAVRKYSIIKGDEKGNFNPEANITYGEAATIMLRMLGYTTADVGMMWPADYINKAQNIGLDNGMKRTNADERLTRGQAAILLCNMLLTETKEGAVYASTAHSTGSAHSVLLSTSQTNPKLSAGQVSVYFDGATKTYASSGKIAPSLCGVMGMPVFEGRTQSRIKGFIADIGSADVERVTGVTSTELTLRSGAINVPRDTLTMAGGTIGEYITCWFDIKEGEDISLYYDESGELEFISTRSRAIISAGETFIFGEDSSSLPSGAKYIKNGAEISRNDVKPYDVVSYSPSSDTYYVSSDRVTLLYQSGSPVYSNPSRVTAGGIDFNVSESAGKYFSQTGIKLGGRMTVLLDYNGNLAAVMPTGKVTAKAVGIVSSVSDEKCTVNLLCGLTVSGKPDLSGTSTVPMGNGRRVNSIYRNDGQLVEVSQNTDGELRLTALSMSAVRGEFDLDKMTIGNTKVSPAVSVYECAKRGSSLHKISLSEITASKLPSSKILHTETDSNGAVTMMVLEDVTSERYIYGMIQLKREKNDVEGLDGPITQTEYTYNVRTNDSTYTYSTALGSDMNPTAGYVPAAISSDLVGDNAKPYNFTTPAFALTRAATVGRNDYDAYRGFKVKSSYIPVSDDVVVYCSTSKTFIPTLGEARANFSEFSLYLDRPANEGGIVRVIVVK